MRFLIDECLSGRLAVLLVDAGHDAVHAGHLGLLGATDEAVLLAAMTETRVVVSADTDFGGILAASRAQHPSVILFRRQGRTAEQQAALLLANLSTLEDDLAAGSVVVMLQDHLRVRRLPVTDESHSGKRT